MYVLYVSIYSCSWQSLRLRRKKHFRANPYRIQCTHVHTASFGRIPHIPLSSHPFTCALLFLTWASTSGPAHRVDHTNATVRWEIHRSCYILRVVCDTQSQNICPDCVRYTAGLIYYILSCSCHRLIKNNNCMLNLPPRNGFCVFHAVCLFSLMCAIALFSKLKTGTCHTALIIMMDPGLSIGTLRQS